MANDTMLGEKGIKFVEDTDLHTFTATPDSVTANAANAFPMLNASGLLPTANGGTGVNNAGTITNATATTITGGGTLALGGFTLTVPATGTAALLGTAQTITGLKDFATASGAQYKAAGISMFHQATKPTGATGDRWYDTGEKLWFIYDGAQWVSEELFCVSTGYDGSAAFTRYYLAPWFNGHTTIYVEQLNWHMAIWNASTSANHVWFALRGRDSGTNMVTVAGPVYSCIPENAANSYAITDNVATITTATPHDFVAGDLITIADCDEADLNGDWTVASAPTTTSLTFAITHGNVVEATDANMEVSCRTQAMMNRVRNVNAAVTRAACTAMYVSIEVTGVATYYGCASMTYRVVHE